MNRYLLFRLYGPMAAWGDTAVGEFRPSQTHPGRSAILGLLAAALGLRRPYRVQEPKEKQEWEEALQTLNRNIQVAVRLDLPGTPLRDYHTIQTPPSSKKTHYYTRRDELAVAKEKLNTILSQREYLIDSGATIALHAPEVDKVELERWQNALQKPLLSLYLGRKSCPLALPTAPEVIDAENLKDAFAEYPGCEQILGEQKSPNTHWLDKQEKESVRYFWEGTDDSLGKNLTARRRDQLLNRERWQFAERDEHQAIHSKADTPQQAAPEQET